LMPSGTRRGPLLENCPVFFENHYNHIYSR
jgi:hypothetical protein